MKVLLVVEQNPEDLDFYLLEDVTKDEALVLRTAHGHRVGLSGTTEEQDGAINKILAAVAIPKNKRHHDDVDAAWVKKDWHDCKIDMKSSTKLPECQLVVTGIIL